MIRIYRNFLNVLQRSRSASILNIMGLSVAFAVFIAILIQVNYEYSYNSSFPKADRIYRLELRHSSEAIYQALLPLPGFEIIRAEIPELSVSCLVDKPWRSANFTVVKPDGNMDFFEEGPAYADTNVVRVFDLEVVAGDYRQALTMPGQLFIPLSVAQKFFGETDVIGRTVLFNGAREMTVAAVYRDVPQNSTFQNVLYSASFSSGTQWAQWNYESYYVIPEGTDMEMLADKLRGLDKIVAGKNSGEKMFADHDLMFLPLKDIYFADVQHLHEPAGNRMMTHILLLIGILVLVVAIVNFVNFSMALAPSRIKSLNTQKTFGAGNRFLRWCVISEAMIFSFLAFLLGVFWCYLLGQTFVQEVMYTSLNPFVHSGLLAGVGSVSLIVGVLAGCYPAFYMTSFSPALVLKGSQALSPRGIFLRNTLMVFQYTVAVALIIGILFIGRQLEMVKNRPWGIEKEHIVYLKSNKDMVQKRTAFVNELRQNPAVTDVTFASELIGDTGMQHWFFDDMIDGEQKRIECDVSMIAPNYLNFFGIEVIEGDRFVSTQDSMVMVNETFKKTYHFDPMGKEMAGMRVGRILKDFNILPLQQSIRPLLLAVNEEWAGNYFYIKINGAARNKALTHIRKTIRELSPTYGGDVRFLNDHLNSLYKGEERLGTLVNIFGLATILLALMGVYGLVLFNSKYKAKEIGVRKVNGATNWQMIIFLNRDFIRMVVLSFVLACPLSWYAISVWLSGFAYKTSLSVWVFLLAGVIVLSITLLTISWQSWKAANANPVEVLKNE